MRRQGKDPNIKTEAIFKRLEMLYKFCGSKKLWKGRIERPEKSTILKIHYCRSQGRTAYVGIGQGYNCEEEQVDNMTTAAEFQEKEEIEVDEQLEGSTEEQKHGGDIAQP